MRTVAKHDEFIDYSASTSVERLARDVETVLRSWHVVEGSDRHASMRVPKHAKDKSATHASPLLHTAQTSVQLLRSEQLSWQISFYLPNGEHISDTVDVELALWDGDLNRSTVEVDERATLPLSLQRADGLEKMPLDVFANFSTLFGIGQHISLTPLQVSLGNELWGYLSESIQQRHDKSASLLSVTSVLSGWLQTALNLAAVSSRCYFPVFGLWGTYQPLKQSEANLLPAWLQASQQMALKEIPYRRRRKYKSSLNHQYAPPVMAGQCLIPPTHQNDDKNVVFWTALLPQASNARLTGTDSRLTVWGEVLLRHCSDDSVALWGARHVYSWTRPTPTTRYTGLFTEDDGWNDKIWRKRVSTRETVDPNTAAGYRTLCQKYALKLMEEAANVSEDEPLWGPIQDPLASIHATVTWNALHGGADKELQPLLALPLKIRSRNSMSTEDFIEAEESIEQSILDPHRPGVFVLQVQGDPEIAAATLTATQRCVLAALIRTATLPSETMLSHLLDHEIMDGWDSGAGNEIANQLADRIQAQPGTKALVAAMDWEYAGEGMISIDEAEKIVADVLDSQIDLGFPELPEESGPVGPQLDELWKPFQKAAPFGRLLSNLFVRMASVRSPSSMALVFSTFCRELRRRWDNRESLPNMHFVPGLDPPPESYTPKRCFSNVGEKAAFAAHVNSSEPDPDDWNCLVGQKMQVFNLCVETAIAEDLRKVEMIEKQTPNTEVFESPSATSHKTSRKPGVDDVQRRSDLEARNLSTDVHHETLNSQTGGGMLDVRDSTAKEMSPNLSQDSDEADLSPVNDSCVPTIPANTKSLMSGAIQALDWSSSGEDASRGSPASQRGTVTDEGTKSVSTHQTSYFDADQEGKVPSIFNLIMGGSGDHNAGSASILEMMIGKDSNSLRKGARCPVQDAFLHNGEQVYAPYLRRPYPLTDDEIVQRRMMLAKQHSDTKASAAIALGQLDVAHRYQKTELSADMSAFKAANPWASFEDFTNWYGSPVNPLEEFGEAISQDIRLGIASADAVQNSIAKTAESSLMMELTRKFWQKTWEAAPPKTAAESEPLFDPVSTAEMALHYLETLHPATLMCNVLAVNLSAAYFGLVYSAEESLSIPCVRASLRRLRNRVEIAINLLALDAVTSGQVSNPFHPGLSSAEAMAACENACIILQQNEVLLARTRSLLSKFPDKFNLIDRILKAAEGSVLSVDDEKERQDILRTVLSQQTDPTSVSSKPSPTLREYLLRNYDSDNPCQLSVRYGNHMKDLKSEGVLLMSLTKTQSLARV